MARGIRVVLLVMNVVLGWSGQAQAQPPSNVYMVLGRLSEALPAPGGSLRADVVDSPRYAVRVSGERVTVTTALLREASINALAASVMCQLLPEPVSFAISMERAGFDGPSGLAELNEWALYDAATESQYRAAVNAARSDVMQAMFQDSFWMFTWPGYDLMHGWLLDAATARYDEALATYEAYRAERPDLPAITAQFIREVTEVTMALRSGSAGVSPWEPRIQETLKAYPPRREQ